MKKNIDFETRMFGTFFPTMLTELVGGGDVRSQILLSKGWATIFGARQPRNIRQMGLVWSGLVFLSVILSCRSRSTHPNLASFYQKLLPQYYPSKILINDMLLFCLDMFQGKDAIAASASSDTGACQMKYNLAAISFRYH